MATQRYFELHPSQLMAGVFAGVILAGALLLKLPFATHEGVSFVDALFTATSATCVTGLMVVDAGTTFTTFGQVVILALIQLGGLGIMTFSTFFLILVGRALSMKESAIVFDTFDQRRRLSIRELLKRVMALTFTVEALGALVLYAHWAPDHGAARAAYYAVFHAVSGFCNAGICLFPDSLISFAGDPVVNGVIGALIVIGSLGFLTIVELQMSAVSMARGEPTRLSLNCKMVLVVTAGLMAAGAVLTYAMERPHVFAGMEPAEQAMAAVFQSITRTAGFITVDFHEFSNGTLYVFILLMFIGAAPGSVGGGIKVTTFGVLVALAWSRLQARETVSVFHRTIPEEIVSRALSVLFVSVQIVVVFTLLLLITESGGPESETHRDMFMQIMFEVVSAFGTVGLSAGATGSFSEFGKILITLLMLMGRLGPLTVTMVVARRGAKGSFRYSEENVMVG